VELSIRALWMSRNPDNEDGTAEIVARIVRGDRAAFGEIVVRHHRRVLTLAFRLLGTREDAQDAAQEVFLRVLKYLRRFDTSKSLEPWLVRTTVNVCRELERKRLQRQIAFGGSSASEPEDPENDPHAELVLEEQRRMIHHALKGLGERERMAVVLRDIEGLTTSEVADILGSDESTIRCQISVARLKIRKAVERSKGGSR